MNKDTLYIYTDGGCSGNQESENLGGWGAAIEYGKFYREIYGSEKNTTNNRMEMTALLEAFKVIDKEMNFSSDVKIQVFSDSSYVMDCFRLGWYKNWRLNGWKNARKQPIANKEIWEQLIFYAEMFNVTFNKVKGHLDNASASVLKAAYEKFVKYNGGYSFRDFLYVVDKNIRADVLVNIGIDELRRNL